MLSGDRLTALAEKFRQQERFATGYSPLYAGLFAAVAGWLSAPQSAGDPLVAWLLQAGAGRQTLDITLLLAAGLHRDILAGEPALGQLAHFYPTAGGHYQEGDAGFNGVLRQAILDRRTTLATFIQEANVQTNETGRGLSWLLPIYATGWPAVDLIDLGASAGLNLVADQRAYQLVVADAALREVLLNAGLSNPLQFTTRCRGSLDAITYLADKSLPSITARIGCDMAPFHLSTTSDELTLISFIWGDQRARLDRLREGIAAFHETEKSNVPVKLYPLDLPVELDHFLTQKLPVQKNRPVVIYNTYMTTYLIDKGQSLFTRIDRWAQKQSRPVLWLQWEPVRDGQQPPAYGWCAWTVDLWQSGNHRHWQLGWVHPHGAEVVFEDGLNDWVSFWGAA